MALTTLAEAKIYMDVKTSAHDGEITRLVAQADGVVQHLAGPALQRATFVERYAGGPTVLLDRYPVVSLTSVAAITRGVAGTADTTGYIVDASSGLIAPPFTSGQIEVTYLAGPLNPPAEAVDAALVFISYKYRRNHGGSESYMPAGPDGAVAPPMGVDALHRQIRLALGSYARGMRVA